MIGMAVGEVSRLAWDVLRDRIHFAIAIGDEAARGAMRKAANPELGDPPLEIGETGAAGLAALIEVMRNEDLARLLGLNSESRALVISTEGAIDRDSYAAIIAEATAEEPEMHVRVAAEAKSS